MNKHKYKICTNKYCEMPVKELEHYYFNKNNNVYSSQCKLCILHKLKKKNYDDDDDDDDKLIDNELYRKCSNVNCINPWKILNKDNFYWRNDKKGWRKNCKNCFRAKVKIYRECNPEAVALANKQWRENNRELVKISDRIKHRQMRKTPINKIHNSISRRVNSALKKSGNSKNNRSILTYLPYTIEELKLYLETKFEPWMNWDNYGQASTKKRTWNIDHIIPRAHLPYSSFEDDNFKKCWALENLRPIDAIDNCKKGDKNV